MNAPKTPVRPAAVRRKIEAWLAEPDGFEAIVLRARPEWSDEPCFTVNGVPVRVVPCPTPIAVRAALADRSAGEKLVLLTDLTEQELGDGLLAHVSRHKARSVDPWDLVAQAFGGPPQIDSSLILTGRWSADALTELAPAKGWPPPPGIILTREHALRHLSGALLDLAPDELDAVGLLRWSTNAPGQLRFREHPDSWIEGIGQFLVEIAGTIAVPVVAAVRAGHGMDVIPLGLLAGVLWPRDALTSADLQTAIGRTRLEPRFGGVRLNDGQATALRDAADVWIYRALDDPATRPEAYRMLHRAESIAAEIDLTGRLAASDLLPAGFAQRMRAFGAAVRLALPVAGATTCSIGQIEKAQERLAEVEAHRSGDLVRVETARMAVRLLRWLAAPDATAPATMLEALHRQVRDDSWVDRARLDVFAGDIDEQVAAAYQALHAAIDARRARHDEQFALLLQDMTSREREPGTLLRVEDVLSRVVQPVLDNGRRVLLLVLDGMSTAAGIEIADSIARTGPWTELTPQGGSRTGVLAALPTITAVNRCSLLSGRLSVGDRNAELRAFSIRFPGSMLLHKADLRTSAGLAVDPDAAAAIGDPSVPVVAAVINTIDDALDRSDPGTIEWSAETIKGLRDLLAVAQDRVVVLLSDHGHVVDRGREAVQRRSDSSENRWRPASGTPGDGELVFSGSRVPIGDGEVILPWREELRYGPRKAGYHGGAAAAEVVIPLFLFAAHDETAVPGWAGAPVASPEWWREPLRQSEPTSPARQMQSSVQQLARKSRSVAQDQGLFDLPAPPAAASVTEAAAPLAPAPALHDQTKALVVALLASPLFADRQDTRAPIPEERMTALLTTLIQRNGRATLETLATKAAVPAHRIMGTFTALRRLLQVEGYPVLSLDADGHTAKLDIPMMVEQFRLEIR